MDITALAAELAAGHPDTGPYHAEAATAAGQLNVVNRTRNRVSMTGSEVLNAVNAVEWLALTDGDRQTVWNIVHLGTLDPFGVEATLLIEVFGSGAATITALAAARKEGISRATELGFGHVRAGDVQRARA